MSGQAGLVHDGYSIHADLKIRLSRVTIPLFKCFLPVVKVPVGTQGPDSSGAHGQINKFAIHLEKTLIIIITF
jgi:hypothetical protein